MKVWMLISNILIVLIGAVYSLEGLEVNNLDVKAVALLLFGVLNLVLTLTNKYSFAK